MEHQATFAKDCQITDNILVAFKILHCMTKHNLRSFGFMSLKIDMSKAYDHVE